MIDNPDTIAAIATPVGKGGIGVIRLSGPRAYSILTRISSNTPPPRQACYCAFKNAAGETLDKGIAIYFKAPASYTGEDVVEMQVHGSQVVLAEMLDETVKQGARLARAGEFTERAFLNGKLDLLQAEAVADLVDSASVQAAQSAMRSLHGEFSAKIASLLESLTHIRVFIEGALDFPEEEIDFIADSDIREQLLSAIEQTGIILREANQGRVLREGIHLAIIGPPNVGKSSLLNILSRTDRAIVTPIPGTTRDVLEDKILLDGIPVNLVDTAGIRETSDLVELEGIRRSQIAATDADLVLLMLEATEKGRQGIVEELLENKPAITLYNKIDLYDIPAGARLNSNGETEVFISAKTGEGIDLLKEQIKQFIGVSGPMETSLSGRARHMEALRQTSECLKKAAANFASKKPAAELVAEDMKRAQQSLEAITGESVADDLLGEIFSRFCIGK